MKLERVLWPTMIIVNCTLCAVVGAQSPGSPAQASGAAQGQIGSTLPPSLGAAGGMKSASSSGPIAVPEDFAKLRIAPGFLLDSQVFDEPDLSGQFRVDEQGDITVPMVGKVHLEGAALGEAKQKIEGALRSSEILLDPQVTLDIVQYAPSIVTVLGEVRSPGRLQMQVPHSLLDVLSFAGGETELAGGSVQVQHQDNSNAQISTYHYERNGDGSGIRGVMLHDGDTVVVPRAGIVYVLGAVNHPGGFLMQEDGKLDAAQALSLAMGTIMYAKTTDIRIIRRNPDGTYLEFMLNYEKMAIGKIVPPQLQAQDIVYVPVSHIKASAVSITSLVAATSSAAIYTLR